MRYENQSLTSVGGLLSLLNGHIEDHDEPVWFRGQARSDWDLNPKMLRVDGGRPESHLINRFRQNASYILQQPQQSISDFDWMFLMQHHGAPTRLLDWTESALVGLYFCVSEHSDAEGALWMLAPCDLNALSNYEPEYPHEIPSFEDSQLLNYSPKTVASETKTKLLPMAAIGVRNSPRMHAQQGVFTVAHRGESRLNRLAEARPESRFLWKYLVPAESKAVIRKELGLLGFGKFQLFPELTSIAEGISQ